MSTLITHLREIACSGHPIGDEAADEIEALRAKVEDLERQVQEAHAELGLASQTDVQARLHARVEELGRENKIIASQRDTYRDAVSTLEVQGVTGMVEDWVCVPASEWLQVFEKLNQP